MTCLHCGEAIGLGEVFEQRPIIGVEGASMGHIHHECAARLALGSVGHQKQRCSCYGGAEEDPPGLPKREAAKAALALAKGRA